jgi:type IV secretory pathway VirB2 component (pilin)
MCPPRTFVLIAALAFWAGLASAQPSHPTYSADGLYNLANSYARAGKPGLAVLAYERAGLLAPHDPDIAANLAYVRAAAHVVTPPGSRLGQLGLATPPNWAAWLGILGLVVAGAGLVAGKATSRMRWLRRCSLVLGSGLMALAAFNAMLLWPRMHEAVVLIDDTPARVSPAPMADTAFVLREADSVRMLAEHDEFMLVRTGNGRSGWVATANLAAVVPSGSGEH